MTKTIKIFTAISFIAMAIVLTFVGVWALTDLDFTVGGDITYTAPVDEPALTFSYNDSSLTASVIDCRSDVVSVEIPEIVKNNGKTYAVTSIDAYAFEFCESLEDVVFSDSIVSIGYQAFFSCYSLSSVTFGSGLKTIGEFAFEGCESLTSLYIPSHIEEIGEGAFDYLVDVTLGAINFDFNSKAFFRVRLTTLTIESGEIGRDAFSDFISLTTVTLGKDVTYIGSDAFERCINLATVNVKATTVPTGGGSMFYNCHSSLVIYVPSAKVSAYQKATYWKDYTIEGKNF
jgi:hypothetical protein